MPWFWKGRKKSTASSIAREWEKTQIPRISSELAKMVPDKIPFLRQIAGSSLENVLKNNMQFLPSEPVELSGDLYQVTDNVMVKAGSDIPLIGKRFSVSINYVISVNTKSKQVVEAKPDLTSLRINLA